MAALSQATLANLNEGTKFSKFKLEFHQGQLSTIRADGPELLEYIMAKMYTSCFPQFSCHSVAF